MHEDFMRLAIEKALAGVRAGQLPYGAAVVQAGKVISCEHNGVRAWGDATAHAEVLAIRQACKVLETTDLGAAGCAIYCTCEPCVMCFGACRFAKISTLYYGASISDKNDLSLPDPGLRCEALNQQSGNLIHITPGLLRSDCIRVFKAYLESPPVSETPP